MTVTEILMMLQEYYTPKNPLNETQVNVYLGTLDDIPGDLLELAAKHLIKNGHAFMPKVAELRRAADEVRRSGQYSPKQYYLRDVPGTVQTMDEYYERYGTDEHWIGICEQIESGNLPEGWSLTLDGLQLPQREYA